MTIIGLEINPVIVQDKGFVWNYGLLNSLSAAGAANDCLAGLSIADINLGDSRLIETGASGSGVQEKIEWISEGVGHTDERHTDKMKIVLGDLSRARAF